MHRRGRRAAKSIARVGLAISSLVAVSAAGGASFTAASAPAIAVSTPSTYQSVTPTSPLSMSGTASDANAISSVTLKARDRNSNATFVFKATLTAPGQATTGWSATWTTPRPGSYRLTAVAKNSLGTSSSQTVVFDVAAPSGPAYLTLLFGRSEMARTDPSCRPLPNTVPLTQVAATLKSMGLSATGVVVGQHTADTTETCVTDRVHGTLYASWQDLANLRDNAGMTFVSAGTTYLDNRTLAPAAQEQNICGSLLALNAHGHNRAWGLFAYPNNWSSSTLQTAVTANCYAFGRTYAGGRNANSALASSPWFQGTNSILGGACNDATAACYNLKVVGTATGKQTRYFPLPSLEALMTAQSGEWSVVQMYSFVTGSYASTGGTGVQWDCTPSNWQDHYVTIPETYCWNDFLAALSTIPTGVTVTDPATVAQAVYGSGPPAPTETITAGPANITKDTTATFAFSSSAARSWSACSLDGAPPTVCDSGLTLSGLTDGPHTISVKANDAFGNSGAPARWSWTVDTVAPVVTITSGPASPTTGTSATFSFIADETHSTFVCALDAAAPQPCHSPTTYTALRPQQHVFSVQATDLAGNNGSAATWTWIVS